MVKKTFGMSAGAPIKARLGGGTYRNLSSLGPPPADPDAAFAEAVRFYREGRLRDAESRVRHVLSVEPDNIDAVHRLGLILLRTKRPEEAARWFSQAITGRGNVAEFHINLGVALLSSGKDDEGMESLQKALEIQPGNGEAHLNLGLALLRREDWDEAARNLREAARVMPNSVSAHMNLGLATKREKGYEAAVVHFREAAKLAPQDAQVHTHYGSALMELGGNDAALAEFDAALATLPDAAPLHFSRAQVLERLDRRRDAIAAYERAIQLDDDLAPAHNNLARILSSRGSHEKAITHAQKAVSIWPKNADFRANYGKVLADAGRTSEALICFESLEQEFPEYGDAFIQHAKLLQNSGQFERAREVVDTLRHINPDPTAGFDRLAADGSVQFSDEELAKIASAIDGGDIEEHRIARLCFDMGQVLERRGQFDESFNYYLRGNRIRNVTCEYDPGEERAKNDQLIATFDRGLFEERWEDGMADDRPVFIVGMPRSGTSLVEQIVGSHRWAGAGGELPDFEILARELPEMLGSDVEYPKCVSGLRRKSIHHLASIYLRRMARWFPDARRFLDKMPTNFLRLGLISLMFPRARVLHCRRHPMDTCFSIFAQSFGGYHSYAYDFENLAHFYGEYQRLMDHWIEIQPIPILDVSYEDLVADTEGKTREILEFCGLDWDEDCLDFHRTNRTVRTASNWQVRQPVYKASVARWQRYEDHLHPLKAALECNGISINP